MIANWHYTHLTATSIYTIYVQIANNIWLVDNAAVLLYNKKIEFLIHRDLLPVLLMVLL